MSRSKKDGRRRGSHRDTQHREIWSRRCLKVSGATPGRWAKTITHRFERRQGREIIRTEMNIGSPIAF